MGEPLGGRDRDRRLPLGDRQQLFANSGGKCQKCGKSLGPDWHAAHLNAWANGGATAPSNMAAWCKACNLAVGAVDYGVLKAVPRDWQAMAVPQAVERIYETGVATVSAAPGAGKTLFAGFVFFDLLKRGLVDRMVVVVPRANLVTQWKRSLGDRLGLHLDDHPRDGVLEYQNTRGLIVTYQSLNLRSSAAHRARIEQDRTLVVLDEVHHLGEDRSWGGHMRTMVGDIESHSLVAGARVLNLTGTLFRSQKNSRISTVRYREVETNQIEAQADFTVTADELIRQGQLRKPVLYRVKATAELVELSTGDVTRGEIAELNQKERRAAKRQSVADEQYQRTLIRESLESLARAQQALGGKSAEALKMIYVASDQKAARKAADVINEITGEDYARLVVSDEPKAQQTLQQAMGENRPLAIVSCQMVTEGFDHPPVAVIAYASHFLADLYVAQMMARAMRVTASERQQLKMLPAQILIPDDPDLVAAFENAMIAQMHVLEVNDKQIVDRTPVAVGDGERAVVRSYELLDLSSIEVIGSNVLGEEDNYVTHDEEVEMGDLLTGLGVPPVYASQTVVASRKLKARTRTYSRPEPEPVTTEKANPRTYNEALRRNLDEAEKWWYPHVKKHPDRFGSIADVKTAVNKAAGISFGERDNASPAQLKLAIDFMHREIRSHCNKHDEPLPEFLEAM